MRLFLRDSPELPNAELDLQDPQQPVQLLLKPPKKRKKRRSRRRPMLKWEVCSEKKKNTEERIIIRTIFFSFNLSSPKQTYLSFNYYIVVATLLFKSILN